MLLLNGVITRIIGCSWFLNCAQDSRTDFLRSSLSRENVVPDETNVFTVEDLGVLEQWVLIQARTPPQTQEPPKVHQGIVRPRSEPVCSVRPVHDRERCYSFLSAFVQKRQRRRILRATTRCSQLWPPFEKNSGAKEQGVEKNFCWTFDSQAAKAFCSPCSS